MAKTPELHCEKWIKDLQRPLTAEERRELKRQIESEMRVRDQVVVMQGDVIIDGHNRYEIAKELDIDCPFTIVRFDQPKQEVPIWIWRNQIGRRNLTPDDFQLYVARIYNAGKMEHGGDRKSSGQNVHLIGKTAEKLADESGINERTIRRKAVVAEAIDSLPVNLQTAHKNKALRGTDEELIALSKLPGDQQQQVARRQRAGGQGLGEAIKAVSGKSAATVAKPAKAADGKPPRKAKVIEHSSAKLADAMIRAISPLVRQLDMLATCNGGKGKCHKQANDALNALIGAVKKMRTGER